MNDLFIINVYALQHMNWMDKFAYTVKSGPYGAYFVFKVTPKEKKKLLKIIRKKHIKYKVYEKKWERSSNYRNKFFSSNKPPYRCRYCNKLLNEGNLYVDHIYPVAAGKYKPETRWLLYIRNISNVNDVKNLAPSCFKCNSRKGEKLGLWYVKGVLGKYRLYWVVHYITKFILIILSLLGLYYVLFSGKVNFSYVFKILLDQINGL